MAKKDKDFIINIIKWAVSIGAGVLIGLVFVNLIAEPANIFGESMEPTLSHNDKVIVNKLAYRFGKPKKGDIIVFPHEEMKAVKYYIKRVAGLPGDVIDHKGGAIYVNDVKYDAYSNGTTEIGNITYPLTVPPGCYFVIGDNMNNSEDSRYSEVGCIALKEITGKLGFRLLPLKKIGVVK